MAMNKFKLGEKCVVKDFSNGVVDDMLPIETAKVIGITDKQITFDIGYDTIRLKLRSAAKWQWCFYESVLITPVKT